MSAFVVTHETINCVVSAWFGDRQHEKTPDELTAIGRKLLAMNVRAVCQRYGEVAELHETVEPFRYSPGCYSVFQQLKSVNCLSYQCSEGSVPKMRLYKKLSDVESRLAYKIATDDPRYDSAKWELGGWTSRL